MVEIWAIPIWNGHCAGMHCSVQPENSVLRVQGSLNLTFAHTGKFGRILCYTCDVVRMVHEQHDAACSGRRVEWSRYGQYQFRMGIVRARTVKFNLKIASLVCKGAGTSHLHTRANSGKFSATCARWFVWYTNIMMHLVLTRGLSGRDMGNTNLKWSLCGHALFSST